VVVPTTGPESTVTVGATALVGAVWHTEKRMEKKVTSSRCEMVAIVAIEWMDGWTARAVIGKAKIQQQRVFKKPQQRFAACLELTML
jgi:hypothetical protein